MSALLEEHSSKKQRAAPPQRDKRHAGEDTLDDDDETTPPALAVELRTDGYRVAAMRQPAPLASEAKRARGAAKQPEPKPAFGELRPYGTAAAAALLRALDTKVLPRALAPGLAGVVRLRIVDRRPAAAARARSRAASAATRTQRRQPRRGESARRYPGGRSRTRLTTMAATIRTKVVMRRRRRSSSPSPPRAATSSTSSSRRKRRRRRPWRRCGRDWRSSWTCRAHTVWPPSSI